MFVALGFSGVNRPRAEKYARASQRLRADQLRQLTGSILGDSRLATTASSSRQTIQPFVRIGSNVTLWSGNHIGHDATIGDHCFIASHVVIPAT